MMADSVNERDRLRSYGRRKGHRLTERKSRLVEMRLPQLRLDPSAPPPSPLGALFPGVVRAIWLEIGFGGGEHLAWQAAHNPDIGLIGCEPFLNGLAALITEAEEQQLRNIRVHDGDAREILGWLPEGSISRAFMLFPDPWPKKRHTKRRLLNAETASLIARALRPGGEFRFASDWPSYVEQGLRVLLQSGRFEWLAEGPKDWRDRPADWPQTRYEKKAVREGRTSAYLSFRRI
jgi:tRNA (guanine-N7-)-methyltransferase